MKRSDALDPTDLRFFAAYRSAPKWGYCAIVQHIPSGAELVLSKPAHCSLECAIREAKEAESQAKNRQRFYRNVHLWPNPTLEQTRGGRSPHLELGYAAGELKHTIVLLEEGCEPELRYNIVNDLCCSIPEVVEKLS